MDKPEALRLADELERDKWHVPAVVMQAAADELRRLHAALRKIGQYTGEGPTYSTPWQDIVADLGQTARAAIKAVEGEKR